MLLRDIFYRDVQLFRTQRVVDTVSNRRIDYGSNITDHNSQLVDDVAATFQLERSDLNIVEEFNLPLYTIS